MCGRVRVSTYATISVVFWYIGMIPDLGTLAIARPAQLGSSFTYGLLAVGWSRSVRHWGAVRTARLLLAGLATAAGAFGAQRDQASISRWR